ncbi:MAG TPA: STAS domain-containing protein [Solirubrobacteraceae bacterium]|nr:STAS domain-containing protein [Solirubrobacteraceae bacterium]
MTSLVTVREDWHGDVPVARIEGEVDAANVADVAARLRGLMTNRAMRLVVDLAATSYLDSAGINLLFAIGEELRSRQQKLHLVVAEGSPVTRMLRLTSLDRAHPTHASVEEALAA